MNSLKNPTEKLFADCPLFLRLFVRIPRLLLRHVDNCWRSLSLKQWYLKQWQPSARTTSANACPCHDRTKDVCYFKEFMEPSNLSSLRLCVLFQCVFPMERPILMESPGTQIYGPLALWNVCSALAMSPSKNVRKSTAPIGTPASILKK